MPLMDEEEEEIPVTTLLVIIVCVLAFICVVVALIWCCARGSWKKAKRRRRVVKTRVINPGAIIPYAPPMSYAPPVTSNINVQCSCGNRAVATPANNAPPGNGGNYNLRVVPVAGNGAPAGVCPIVSSKPAMVSVPKSAPMYPWLRKYFNSTIDHVNVHGQHQQRSAGGPSYIVQEPMEPVYASNNANIPIITPITTDDRCPSCPQGNPGFSNGGYTGCGGCGESIYSHATTDYSNNYSHYTSAYGGNNVNHGQGQGPHVVSIGL